MLRARLCGIDDFDQKLKLGLRIDLAVLADPLDQPVGIGLRDVAVGLCLMHNEIRQAFKEELDPFRVLLRAIFVQPEQQFSLRFAHDPVAEDLTPERENIVRTDRLFVGDFLYRIGPDGIRHRCTPWLRNYSTH